VPLLNLPVGRRADQQVEATRNGTLEKEKRDHAVSQWTHRGLSVYNKAIRRAKRTAWQTFCSDIERTTDAARLRKILSKTAAPLGYLQKANGS